MNATMELSSSSLKLRRWFNGRSAYAWLAGAIALLTIQLALSLRLKQEVVRTSCILFPYALALLLATGFATFNSIRSIQSTRLFWSFLAIGFALWALNPVAWLYSEFVSGKSLPNLRVSGISLFLHIVFLIAAVAARPHLEVKSQKAYRTTLDFLILLSFWFFLFAFVMFPYLVPRQQLTPLRFEALYSVENAFLLGILAVLFYRTQLPWKEMYGHLFGASALYAAGSLVANFVLARWGAGADSLPAVLYVGAAYWFVFVTFMGRRLTHPIAQADPSEIASSRYSSLLAMLTFVAIPLAGIWELFRSHESPEVRELRLSIVLVSFVALALAAFLREYLIGRDLASDAGQARNQLGLALEVGKAVAWDWDMKGGRAFRFGDLRTMFGIPSDTHSGRIEEFYDYVHPDDRQQVSEAVAAARENRTPYTSEFRIIRADGAVRWVFANGRFSYSKKNGAERMLGMAVDVTHRKQAEEVQRRHDAIVEFSDDAIVSKDLNGIIRSWNRGAQRLFGFSKEEAIGKPIEIIIPEELQAEENEMMKLLRAGEDIEHFDTVRITKEKKKIDVSLTISPIRDSTGKVVGASKIARDVTERKRAEDSLRESEQRFRLVANAAPVMIWMAGPDKLCTYFNLPWLEFTGRSIEAELGNGWAESVYPDDLQACWENYSNAFDRRESFKIEYRLRRHDGRYRWVFDTGVPRFSADGSFLGYIGSCIDISDRKLAEEALSSVSRRLIEAHEEERTRIARELHDDINQRVALLAVNLERLKQNLPAGFDTSGRIDEVCEQISELGSDVQSLSHRLHSSKLDYLGLAAAAASFCRELADRQKVQIDFHATDVPKELPREKSLCLFRVLQEALQNAVKHSGSRHFHVWLCGASHEIRLSVSDSGAGFNPDAAFLGHGLGLTSMKERVRLMAGEFSIDSRLGCGTTIHVRVPLGLAVMAAQAGGSRH